MGRKRKPKQTELEDATEEKAAPAPGGNGFDRDKTTGFVERIENLHADITAIMMEALSQCKSVHGDIAIVYQEAKDGAGIPKKALKKVVKARALEAKARAVREDLEGEDQDNFDLIRQALGDLADTPLGASVLKGMAPDVPNVSTADAPFHAPDDTPAEPRTASEH